MKFRYLGNSGLQVSELSYGAWITFSDQMAEKTAEDCMHAAYENDVNFFDNAETYADGNAEIVMGNILKRSGWNRADYVVSTKIFWGGKGVNRCGLSRKHIIEGTVAALKRLQLEYIDLIYCHRPDYQTPIEETVRAMNFVINQGWAFYWGTSEWSADQILEAYHIARRESLIPPVMEQPQYNMFHRQRVEIEYQPAYSRLGLGLTTWSPLASGLLTGKYSNGLPDDSRAKIKKYQILLKNRLQGDEAKKNIAKVVDLNKIAEREKMSMAQMALAWCLKNENVSSVITGASRPEQVVENMKASDLAERLSSDVMEEIEGILQNRPDPPFEWKR